LFCGAAAAMLKPSINTKAARVQHADSLFLRHSLREAGYLAKFDFLNEATLKKQLRQYGGIQWAWRSWNTASRSNSAKLANIEI
jgi:DUF1365 family protein